MATGGLAEHRLPTLPYARSPTMRSSDAQQPTAQPPGVRQPQANNVEQMEQTYSVGALVEAKYGAQSFGSFAARWYPGSIVAIHSDGSADVLYDDTDFETHVPPKYLRLQAVPTTALKKVRRREALCGTFGCTLPDLHRGLHNTATTASGRQSRQCQLSPAPDTEDVSKRVHKLAPGRKRVPIGPRHQVELPASSDESNGRADERVPMATVGQIAAAFRAEKIAACEWWLTSDEGQFMKKQKLANSSVATLPDKSKCKDKELHFAAMELRAIRARPAEALVDLA